MVTVRFDWETNALGTAVESASANYSIRYPRDYQILRWLEPEIERATCGKIDPG